MRLGERADVTSFVLCASCSRHVREGDGVCPFCSGSTFVGRRPRAPIVLARAAILGFVLTGCYEHHGRETIAREDDAGHDAGMDAGRDAGVDAGAFDAGDAGPITIYGGPSADEVV
jgi:hypothetical protein